MGLFEQFPYTNFHELNLDFILRKLKKLEDRMAELDGKMATLEGKMDVLREEMAQLREAMAALVQLVESFQGTLDSHTQELAALNALCVSLESGLNTLENSVSALAGLMDSVESDIAALCVNLKDATADITKLQDILNHAQFIGAKFTQNGTLELIGRNIDKQSSIVLGAIRMKHYIGENDEDIIISVSGEDIAPGEGWGRWIMYRDDSPAGSLDPGSILADVIGEGFLAARGSKKRKSPDDPYPLALIVEPKHVKSGYTYNLVVPDVIKQTIIDNPTKTFVLQFTYIPQSNIA